MENYEQKYKEAIERCKSWIRGEHPECFTEAQKAGEFIFPELSESEDEKIRKELYDFITCQYGSINDMHYYSWIAWLEKQGENPIEQDTEIYDLWVYIREWNDKFGRLPKDEDELVSCIDYVMKRQKPAEWSKEDEDIINHLIKICSGAKNYNQFAGCSQNDITKYQNWLKSLKDRVQPQPKQDLSEEDKKMKSLIISTLTSMGTLNLERYYHMNLDEVKNWLKSLKPQNRWKPSEEQMESIKYFIDFHRPQANASTEGWQEFKHLESLYNDLKKL